MGPLVFALLAASPLKLEADAAYQAKNYEVACPRYERLASHGRDAWAWNDLALCETKRGGDLKALEALETASKLEAAVPDPKLRKAIDFNVRLLAESVVTCRTGAPSCETVAAALTKIVTEPLELRRKLFAKAVDRLTDDELTGVPNLVFDRGGFGPFDACALISAPTCSRTLLLCSHETSTSNDGTTNSVTMGFFVDPEDEPGWQTVATLPKDGIALHRSSDEGTRCPVYDADGHFLGRPPDSNEVTESIVRADPCSGRLVTVTQSHVACSGETVRKTVGTLSITRPPNGEPARVPSVVGAAPNLAAPSQFSNHYDLDPAHTSVRFSVKHMGIGHVGGVLGQAKGTLMLDEVHPADSSLAVTMALEGLSTGNAKRDDHLRSADFFDVAHFPEATFTATKIERRSPTAFAITGDLTLHGVTKPITLAAQLSPEVTNPISKVRTRGVSATASIDRRDWGLRWNLLLDSKVKLVDDEVKVSIDAELVRPSRQ